MARVSKTRGFAFTDFVCDEAFLRAIECKYMIAGREICPDTGRPHWQCYVYFTNPRSFTSVRNEFAPRHIEPARGNSASNRRYCIKDGEPIFEIGEFPNQGRRSDIIAVSNAIRDGESVDSLMLAGEADKPLAKYVKYFDRLEALVTPSRDWPTVITVIWGRAGTGKTRLARERGGLPVAFSGRFFDYSGEDHVLFDDFDPSEWTRSLWLRICDRYPMRVEVKGGFREWAPHYITFTSNYDPRGWFGHLDEAVQRRINEVIHLT